MSEQILTILKRELDELTSYGGLNAETRRNKLKEALQYYVLNFIYHHPGYNSWIMYGGSALRIIHGLDRMSVDLDFEVPHTVTEKFLEELEKEIAEYFLNTYGAGTDFLTSKITTGRGLLLKFHVGDELSFGHPSKQVHVKIDLNHFVAPKTVTERRPINRDQLSFVILTYNMAALMASKLAAIFLRGIRGVGEAVYEEKGRDIYDLLWYMGKKVVPDFDYLVAKGIDVKDPRALFDKLTLQMNKVNDKNLEQDLEPLFINKTFIGNWLKNWRESYLRLLDDYKINTVTTLAGIQIIKHFDTDNFSFTYSYNTENGKLVRIRYLISDYWIDFKDGDLSVPINNKVSDMTKLEDSTANMQVPIQKKLKQYATIFYQKTEKYFKKTSGIILGDAIITKVIRMTADNLNQKEQIVFNKSALLSCELDDLLR
ncbi:nucleotidyl transferase AbiEii/AbiGii toxin family protein [Patescibacteria group bacterium]|nr:nucleotidyl transferase AbiEii/AbiGii toxin family protein [Patescibacteria group bacterium]MBU4462188.1 nucleotidyl transferase AbiEii/AbiGii toxin family protein [Patescibacteria group bacterium]